MSSDAPFQPFTDRLSRDIRNDLSKSFVLSLEQESMVPVQSAAKRYLEQKITQGCREYIEQRLKRYNRILAIPPEQQGDPYALGFALWDEELFFEVHEIFEPLWLHATGEEKLLIQALIRAAGVYIKYEAGYPEIAARICAKALPVLERNRKLLENYIDAGVLISSLSQPTLPPPRLAKPDRR